MYSKNDYRYYLENQLMHSEDYLAHYGVKGMKWKQHLKKNYRVYNISGERGVYGGPNGQVKTGSYKFKDRGIVSKKNPSRYISVGEKKYSNGKKTKDLYFSPTKKEHYLKKGRLEVNTGEEGSHVSIDVTKKKKKKTKSLTNKDKKVKDDIVKDDIVKDVIVKDKKVKDKVMKKK